MESVVYWYKSEVHFWRTAGSLFWSVTCLLPVTLIIALLSHFSLLQPWIGLAGFLSVTCCFSFFLWLCLLVAVLVAVSYSTTFTVVPDVRSTRLESYLSLLRLSRLMHLSASALGGACVAWFFTHLAGERFYGLTRVVTTADRELLTLNESHLFLVLAGTLAGLVYYCNFYLNHLNYLAFPTLQLDKYYRVWSEVGQLSRQCVRLVWRHLQILYLGYWIFGCTCRSWMMGALNVDAIHGQRLDTVYVLLDLNLLWQTALCAFFILFTWSLMAVLYRIYHTEHLEIPLLSAFGADSKHCLTEALNSNTSPLLQYLAFLDLSHLSRCSPQRRQEVLSLSQPGGHPHTWRSVCGSCLRQLEDLSAQVHAAHLAALTALPVQNLPADKIFSFTGNMSTLHRSVFPSTVQSPGDMSTLHRSVFPSSVQSPGDMSTLHRSMFPSTVQSPDVTGVENLPAPVVPAANKVSFTTKVYSSLKSKPLLSYFLMEFPDAKSKQLFANCQIHIWAIEAISHLAIASYEEDKYGVVQLTLSAVFTAVVSLHDNLEKYFKLQPMALRRSSKDSNPAPHVILCQQLRDVLKTSIYRLTNRYGKHLGELHLKSECAKRLRPFLDFKE